MVDTSQTAIQSLNTNAQHTNIQRKGNLSKDDTRISSKNIELLERKLQKSISIGDVLCANLQELQKDAEGIGSLV